MKPNILTRERLAAIEGSIARNGGHITVRHIMRNHGLHRSVIDEAIEGGFLTLESHQGPRGRPSQILKKVSQCYPTKIPPGYSSLDKLISCRHWNFAFNYAMGEIGPGMFNFKRRAWFAYKKAFPASRSQAGARASSSRLLRKSHIRAAIAWTFAKHFDNLRHKGKEPKTPSEIWTILFQAKSDRTRWASWWERWQWDLQEEAS